MALVTAIFTGIMTWVIAFKSHREHLNLVSLLESNDRVICVKDPAGEIYALQMKGPLDSSTAARLHLLRGTLRHLVISGRQNTDVLVPSLTQLRLESLHLYRVPLIPSEIQLITGSGLNSLTLSGISVTDRHIAAIDTREVSELVIAHASITQDSIDSLANMKALKHLRLVQIKSLGSIVFGNVFSGSAIQSLAILESRFAAIEGISNLPHLRELNIRGTSVQSGIAEVAKRCKELQVLDLSYCNIDGETLASLSNIPHLRELDISGTGIGDSHLNVISGLPALRRLHARESRITRSGKTALETRTGGKLAVNIY